MAGHELAIIPAFDGLEEWLKGQRSLHTRRAYERDVRDFFAYLAGEHGITSPASLTIRECVPYPSYLRDHGFADSTIARKLSACRVALDYAVALGVMDRNPMEYVKAYHVSDVSPRTALSAEDVWKLLAAPDRQTLHGARDYAILMCLCYMALRRAELAALTCGDLHYEKGHTFARIMGKGRRVRRVPIVPEVAEAIRAYLVLDGRATEDAALHDLAARGEEALFKPLKNNHKDWRATPQRERLEKHLTEHSVWRIVRAAASSAGLHHDAHTLRHTALSQAIDGGADLLDVQDFAGHADPRTTRRYLTRARELDRSAGYRVHY